MAREMSQGTSRRLIEAYAALMTKAPGAAFQRARSLYLNKYPLPQDEPDASLRLFVVDEQLEETIQAAEDGNPSHRLVTLTSRPGALAIVHWQRADSPSTEQLESYLSGTWQLNPEHFNLQPFDQPWFRDSGHQCRLATPEGLIWRQRSLITLPE